MRLGEILLQEKLISPDALEEALESQVIHGGRLGTNLVELGHLQEADLAKALGKQHNCAFASGTMTPDPKALETVDLEFADDKDVLPMRLDPTRISVACINPHDLATMDEIGFRTGKRVVPVVIPEFRMNQMLRKYCKAFRNIRPIDLGNFQPSRVKAAQEGKNKPAGADLMSEEEFQSLYAQALEGGEEGGEEATIEGSVVEGELLDEGAIPPELLAQPGAPLAPPPQAMPPPRAPLPQSAFTPTPSTPPGGFPSAPLPPSAFTPPAAVPAAPISQSAFAQPAGASPAAFPSAPLPQSAFTPPAGAGFPSTPVQQSAFTPPAGVTHTPRAPVPNAQPVATPPQAPSSAPSRAPAFVPPQPSAPAAQPTLRYVPSTPTMSPTPASPPAAVPTTPSAPAFAASATPMPGASSPAGAVAPPPARAPASAEQLRAQQVASAPGAPANTRGEPLPPPIADVVAPPVARPSAPPPAAKAPEAPPPTPLTFPEAQQLLAKSVDREDVAITVLRFALGKWKRALLLNVQGPMVTGWHGVGAGIRDKAVRRIGVALRGQSSFKLVCDMRSHFIGPVKRDAGSAVFYRMLGGDYPTTAVMLPLLVRERVVHILYVDNGPGQVTPPDIGELLILGQSVARSYEAMIRRRKTA